MGDADVGAWRKAFASLQPRLVLGLPNGALAPLRVAFDLHRVTSVEEFFSVAEETSIFNGPRPESAVTKLVDTLNACCPQAPVVMDLNRLVVECLPAARKIGGAASDVLSASAPMPPAPATLPRRFERLAEVLIHNGFAALVPRFVEEEVDLETALKLSGEELVSLGVPPHDVTRLKDGLHLGSLIQTAKVRPVGSICGQRHVLWTLPEKTRNESLHSSLIT